MTQPQQKNKERHFAECAAEFLGVSWNLGPDREKPDFIISGEGVKFGLEVAEIFDGRKNRDGSCEKKAEVQCQKILNELKQEYEAISGAYISLKLLGSLTDEVKNKLVPSLLSRHYDLMNPLFTDEYELTSETKIYLTVSPHKTFWTYINLHVGGVNSNALPVIQAEINRKSNLLQSYQNNINLPVRLLIVADRTWNSGKLTTNDDAQADIKDFDTVYFLSYPDKIFVFSNCLMQK